MNKLRIILNFLFGKKNTDRLVGLNKYFHLIASYRTDLMLFKKHSSVFKKDTFCKKESEIVLRYHSIEKGFLHNSVRCSFAQQKVKELIAFFYDRDIIKNIDRFHLQAALSNLYNYYVFHKNRNFDISSFFSNEDFEYISNLIVMPFDSIKQHTYDSYFAKSYSDFKTFSNSRCSVRDFTGEKIPIKTIQNVVNIANNAPSVCNRQPITVHLVENKKFIDEIFNIQGGLSGYSNNLNQVIVLTCNRNYFYSIGERNQLYVDGGIYLMNLLYALHFYKIGACPAHWGMPVKADKKIKLLLDLNESFQVICLIAIGVPNNCFSTTLSLRRTYEENLVLID